MNTFIGSWETIPNRYTDTTYEKLYSVHNQNNIHVFYQDTPLQQTQSWFESMTVFLVGWFTERLKCKICVHHAMQCLNWQRKDYITYRERAFRSRVLASRWFVYFAITYFKNGTLIPKHFHYYLLESKSVSIAQHDWTFSCSSAISSAQQFDVDLDWLQLTFDWSLDCRITRTPLENNPHSWRFYAFLIHFLLIFSIQWKSLLDEK